MGGHSYLGYPRNDKAAAPYNVRILTGHYLYLQFHFISPADVHKIMEFLQ